MKLNKIASLCKSSKTLVLYDREDGTQWCGDGSSMYELTALPTVGERSLCTMMDIAPEKAAKMNIELKQFPEAYSVEPDSEDDIELDFDLYRRLSLDDKEFLPCITPGGALYFIQPKYLGPLNDSKQLKLTVRHTDKGQAYIIAWDGIFITAVIMPLKITGELLHWLGNTYSAACDAARREKEAVEGE